MAEAPRQWAHTQGFARLTVSLPAPSSTDVSGYKARWGDANGTAASAGGFG